MYPPLQQIQEPNCFCKAFDELKLNEPFKVVLRSTLQREVANQNVGQARELLERELSDLLILTQASWCWSLVLINLFCRSRCHRRGLCPLDLLSILNATIWNLRLRCTGRSFVAKCALNHEPMLLTGFLVQLGKEPVFQHHDCP